MITRILIPQLFENMEEATVGSWLRREGDTVAAGDALCELITEKTTLQLEAEVSGLLRLITVPEKSVVPVGATIGVIAAETDDLEAVTKQIEVENSALREREGATQPAAGEVAPVVVSIRVPPPAGPASEAPLATGGGGSRVRATPAARRLARELAVDIEALAAQRPGKVLNEEDVRAFAA